MSSRDQFRGYGSHPTISSSDFSTSSSFQSYSSGLNSGGMSESEKREQPTICARCGAPAGPCHTCPVYWLSSTCQDMEILIRIIQVKKRTKAKCNEVTVNKNCLLNPQTRSSDHKQFEWGMGVVWGDEELKM
uniref:Uncharacterized protein LOC111127141 n=1 Tax=Crassostrea virginica TaxID=6565 RepID=A0A8B8DJK0_CRAVI|nr:uncharacterized protein LOC111127141 [Crassostrea virginica]